MSIFYNTKTIIDGLVLALDAGNIKSYNVGISSTTWTDIIGRGNTGTLTNGPTYSSQNGGSIVFNGDTNYVENLSPNLGISGDTSVTLSCWFYNSVNSSDNQALLVYGNGSTGGDSISILLRNLSFYASFNGGLDAVIADNVYALNTWNNVVVTKTPGAINTTTKLYLNGIEQTITSASSSTPSLSSRVVRVARWTDDTSPYYFLGGVSAALIYNRALTAAEVLQNYNSLKNRFVTAPVLIPVGPYRISRSVRLNSPDSAYLNRTPSVAGNRKTWTWAGWVKRSALAPSSEKAIFIVGTSLAEGTYFNIAFTDDKIVCGTGAAELRRTTSVYRDLSAWYHLVVAIDTTQATAANRVKIYVNGTEVTAFDSSSSPTLNLDTAVNSTLSHNISRNTFNSSNFFDGYLADVHFIDGQALTPSSFTEINATTGQLVPKAYGGTYGVNGFRLNFSNNSAATAATLGADSSGNGNNWTPNNLSVTAGAGNDSLTDTPTSYGTDLGNGNEVRGNYATFNPLDNGVNLSNGNLDASWPSASYRFGYATIPIPQTGKWYYEYTVTSSIGGDCFFGIAVSKGGGGDPLGTNVMYRFDGQKNVDNAYSSYGATFALGDVIGVSINVDVGQVTFYKNNVSQGVISYSFAGKILTPVVTLYATNISVNFGQRQFAYQAPSGFKCLCDTNLPTPTIAKGSSVFDTKLYTGNGSTQTISGLNFSPDWIWVKNRSSITSHILVDTIRGAANVFVSNVTSAEQNIPSYISSLDSNGFSIGTNNVDLNQNANSYVAWAWDAGSSTVTNTAGTITSQVRANAIAGFSVVTFTAQASGTATIGHGLGVEPSFIIVKSRAAAYDWVTYHISNGNTKTIRFLTEAANTSSIWWNNTSPTSTLFTLGAAYAAASTCVAYCFAPVTGYSAFGSYIGNGSTDGSFVYLGLKPAFILIKRTDTTGNWIMLDGKRAGYNVDNDLLLANLGNNEDNITDLLDITSNGFKLRTTNADVNASSGTYIYAAFAENPFQYSRAR